MRSRSRGFTLLGVALAAVTVVTAACESAGAPGPRPIRIGALVPVTALGLSFYASAYEAAARNINLHGGIKGRPVQVEICDDRNDPNQAQVCASRIRRARGV